MYNKKIIAIVLIIAFIGGSSFCKTPRNDKWATPLNIKVLPNCFKVNDGLYRGAQPGAEGFLKLKELGVKTIINFRETDTDSKLIKDMGFNYFHLPTNVLNPDKNLYNKYLEIIRDKANLPAFVHCQFGSDRTGAAIALYRIHVENETVEYAIDEMINGGYGFHRIYQNLPVFIRNFDK